MTGCTMEVRTITQTKMRRETGCRQMVTLEPLLVLVIPTITLSATLNRVIQGRLLLDVDA
jgi:hypothetical protein